VSGPVGLIVALPEESAALRSVMRRVREWRLPDYRAWSGVLGSREIVLAQSGMGHGHATGCARQLLKAERPILLMAAGFAGGLSHELEPGEALVASEVVLVEGDSHRRWPVRLNLEGHRTGVLASPDRVVRFSHEKRELALRTGAHAVDMESGSVVREAEEAGIPWLVVRSVTDGAAEDLPMDFHPFTTKQGLPHKPRIVLHAIVRPRTLWGLMRLGKRTAQAARTLGITVERVLCRVEDQL
jgi:adenosylhomocysteine nucleosidase